MTAQPATLGEALRATVATGGGRHVLYLTDGPRRVEVAELLALAEDRAAVLSRRGVAPGDRVGIMGPTAIDWYAWSYATWLVGGVVVPLPSPIRVRDTEALRWQIASLCDSFDCRLVVAHERFLPVVPARIGVDWAERGNGEQYQAAPAASPDAPAYVLCTSGSTALPKGIHLSHQDAIARNVGPSFLHPGARPLMRQLGIVSMSHGTGAGGVVSILNPDVEMHAVPGERFARDPGELLRLAGPTGATMLGAPASAIRAALRAVERQPRGVDLSGLQRVNFFMEMTAPEVVDQLIEVGGRFGLRPEVVGAMYGLGEGGSATATRAGTGLRVDEVDLTALVTDGRAAPAREGAEVKRVVSCGRPLRGIELRIVGDDGVRPDRHVGEIQVRGPAVMDGYVGPGGEDPFVDGWLRTGDLGYMAEGELFVTGRSKEVIIQRGRKYHPEDLEWAAARVPGVVAGRCVAFSPMRGQEGDVVVAVELADAGVQAPDVEAAVRAAVTNAVGLVPRHVLVLADGAIPVAPAGKLQRLAARDAYDRGELGE
jgi:fatty-acyl-CoA synthase